MIEMMGTVDIDELGYPLNRIVLEKEAGRYKTLKTLA